MAASVLNGFHIRTGDNRIIWPTKTSKGDKILKLHYKGPDNPGTSICGAFYKPFGDTQLITPVAGDIATTKGVEGQWNYMGNVKFQGKVCPVYCNSGVEFTRGYDAIDAFCYASGTEQLPGTNGTIMAVGLPLDNIEVFCIKMYYATYWCKELTIEYGGNSVTFTSPEFGLMDGQPSPNEARKSVYWAGMNLVTGEKIYYYSGTWKAPIAKA